MTAITTSQPTLGPRASWFNVAMMGTGHFISDFYCNVLPVMLPILALRFNLSYSQCGALFMVFSVSTNFIQPPIGILADRYRINYLMPLSILTGGILSCALGICDSIYLVLLIVLLSGIAASGFHPIAGGVMPHVCKKGTEVLSTSIFIAGGNLGFAIAPVIVAYYIEQAGERNLLYLALPAVIFTLMLFMLKFHQNPKQPDNFHTPNLREIISNRPFMAFILSIGLRSWCYCALLIYTPLLLTSEHLSSVQSASALMVMLLGTVVGGLAVGAFSAKFRLKPLILATYVISAVGLCAFLYHPQLNFFSYSALFVTGAGMYGSTPVAIVWARRMLSDHAAALATSIMLGFAFGIGYIASVATGFLGDFIGLRYGILFTVLPALIIAFGILMLLTEPKPQVTSLTDSSK
ncbi:MAG: MFS transporter [Succinivibrio sp.]|nr:MFS transporter [Succinivibrio sp.]